MIEGYWEIMTADCGTSSRPDSSQWLCGRSLKISAPSLVVWLCALLFIFWGISNSAAADSKVDEYDLKTVYLYNFSKFISWPDSRFENSDDTFNICIDGPLPSKAIITQLLNRTTQGRELNIYPLGNLDNHETCHILYFRDGQREKIEPTLSSLKNKSILTVGDYQGFAKSGGVVEFAVNRNNKLELIINLGQAKADGIQISAQLLEIASVVHHERHH